MATGLFGGGIIGGIVVIVFLLCGLALLAAIFAPLFMLLTGGMLGSGLFGMGPVTMIPGGQVIPTIVPTVIGGRRRRAVVSIQIDHYYALDFCSCRQSNNILCLVEFPSRNWSNFIAR